MKKIEFRYAGEVFEATVTKSKRKSLAISVGTDGVVKVKAPMVLSDAAILEWVESKAGWIIRKRKEMLDLPGYQEAKQYVSGEKFLFLGQEYELEVRESTARAGTVGIVEDKLVVFVKGSTGDIKENTASEEKRNMEVLQKSSVSEEVRNALWHWYEKQARIWIPRRVRYYAGEIGETYQRITLKNQKKRWGSCSSARNLNFNWRLVMAPLDVLDYVVVHELCHLKQMNHSAAFWTEVEKVLPDYKERKKWLDENGRMLKLE